MFNFFKKNQYHVFTILILLFAICLRFYKLGDIPHGMTWDEAAIGYNGFAIFNTRRDEWLEQLPVSFQSFGDYKAPFSIYLNGFFTFIFGMNLFAVRLPFAIFSIFSIFGLMLLVKEIFKKNKLVNYYALYSGLIITISPWHFHYSRTGFESGIALAFFIWGTFFLLKTLDTNFKIWIYKIGSVISYSLALYTYHSSKIVIPLLMLVILALNFKKIVNNIKKFYWSIIFWIILLIPIFKDSLFGLGLTRANATILTQEVSFYEKVIFILKNFLSHLSPSFLIFGETTTLRHGTGYLGVLSFSTLFLIVISIIKLFIKRSKDKNQLIFLILIFIGLLPACLSAEIPHSNRAFLALPGFLISSIYGLDWAINKINKSKINLSEKGSHEEKNIILKSFIGTLLMIDIITSISFFNNYFNEFKIKSADDFKDGYIEAFKIASDYEKGTNGIEVEKIIFTSDYGQPYIYALFVRKTNPIWYRGGSLIKYEFTEKIDINDLNRKNALIVGSSSDSLPIENADHVINGSDGIMKFQIYKTDNN